MDVAQETRVRRWAEYCGHAQRRLNPEEDFLFLDRLKACFGDRAAEFSEQLVGLLYEFWLDGVCVGAAEPDVYQHDGTNRRVRILGHFGDRAIEFSDDLRKLLIGLWLDAKDYGAGRMCYRCGTTEGVEVLEAMTSYCEVEGEPDPNHPTPYCPECGQEYKEHWDEMWAEYYSGRL